MNPTLKLASISAGPSTGLRTGGGLSVNTTGGVVVDIPAAPATPAPAPKKDAKGNLVAVRLNIWPVWRGRALAHLRSDIARTYSERSKLRYGRTEAPDQSPLVEILLWEKDGEAAWQEAKAGICHERLWLQLADIRAKEHPEDAIAVYRRQVAHLVQLTNNHSYEEAITLVKKIKPLLTRCRGTSSVSDYLAELRVTFKAKRNFMKMLDQIR